jgi:cellulose synthase (UDP-forming)
MTSAITADGVRRRRSSLVAAFMLAATVATVVGFGSSAILAAVHSHQTVLGDLDTSAVVVCALGFFSGSVAYQLARLGWHARSRAGSSALTSDGDRLPGGQGGDLVVLVPAYKEEARVVRRTMLSAALQQHPGRRIMLLIDDPPAPAGSPDHELLAAARRLPGEIETLLGAAHETVLSFVTRARSQLDAVRPAREVARTLAEGHRWVAGWLEGLADGWDVCDHEDELFVDRIVRGLSRINRAWATQLEEGRPTQADPRALQLACGRLAGQLDVSVGSFERKRYANTNHEPNKAMNLNVYLSLLGRTVVEEEGPDGLRLRCAEPGETGMLVPDATFVLTLDADSMLLPDYSLRLLHHLEAPGNERIAVAQTPYSAVPGGLRPQPGPRPRQPGRGPQVRLPGGDRPQDPLRPDLTYGMGWLVGVAAVRDSLLLAVAPLRRVPQAPPSPAGDGEVAQG